MHFFPSDRKVTNYKNIGMEKPSTALRFLTPKKLKYAILFNEDGIGHASLFFEGWSVIADLSKSK